MKRFKVTVGFQGDVSGEVEAENNMEAILKFRQELDDIEILGCLHPCNEAHEIL